MAAPPSSPTPSAPTLRRRPSALKIGRLSPYHVPSAPPSEPRTPPPSTPPCSGPYNPLLAVPGDGAGWPSRRPLLRRKSSLSSVSSGWSEDDGLSVGGDGDNEQWTEAEEDVLSRTLESYVAAAATTDARPPTNLANLVAKASAPVVNHGLRATRKKIMSLVKDREKTPRAGDPDATPRPGGRRSTGMVRQGSMDFLPTQRNVALVARLGSKLQSVHPYAGSSAPPAGGRPRLYRTHSLSSIAGSPSQAPVSPRKVSAGEPSGGVSVAMALDFGGPLGAAGASLKRPLGLGEGLGSAFPSPSLEGGFEASRGGRKKTRRNTEPDAVADQDYFASSSSVSSSSSSLGSLAGIATAVPLQRENLGPAFNEYWIGSRPSSSHLSSSASTASSLTSFSTLSGHDEGHLTSATSEASDAGTTYADSLYSASTTSLGLRSLRDQNSSSSLAALADQMALDSDCEGGGEREPDDDGPEVTEEEESYFSPSRYVRAAWRRK